MVYIYALKGAPRNGHYLGAKIDLVPFFSLFSANWGRCVLGRERAKTGNHTERREKREAAATVANIRQETTPPAP